MIQKSNPLLDKIFLDIESLRDAEERAARVKEEKKLISFWIACSYKERFEELQTRTGNEFGKQIQSIIMEAIDLAIEKL